MQILGITLDKLYFRLALIEKTQKRSQILYLKSFFISEVDAVKQLYKDSFKGKICSSLSAKNLLMRELNISAKSTKHLEEIIAFQTDATSHLSESDFLSIPVIVEQTKEKTNTMLFTASRAGIREHLDLLQRIQIDPDLVTASPIALMNYLKWKMPHVQDAFLVDLGSDEWTCVCMEKGVLKKFHSITGGIESLLEALWEDRKKILIPKEITGIAKQIDLLQLQATLNSQLSDRMIAMRKELARVIFSFSTSWGQKPLFFTGRVDSFGQLKEFLEEALADSVSPNLMEELPKEEQKHALSIGLAVGYDQKPVQFLQDEFFPKKTWKKMGLASLYLGVASMVFSLGMIACSNFFLHSKGEKMISNLRLSLNEWDRTLASEIFIPKSEEEILERWNKAIRLHSKDYAYIMQSPKVAEVLSWIYQHPCISEVQEDPIEIRALRYQLVQYPKLDSPRDPYQAKIEMEFSTTSPLNARKFHEAIYQGEGWADNTQDIQWETSDNHYHISFYLKDKKNA